MKLFIYVTDIEDALKGNFTWSLTLSDRNDLEDVGSNKWVIIKEIEVDLEVDREALTGQAIDNLSSQIKEVEATAAAAVTQLKGRQQNLLALTQEES